jgi:hypothetical protein
MRQIDRYLTLGKSHGQVFCLFTYNFFTKNFFDLGCLSFSMRYD